MEICRRSSWLFLIFGVCVLITLQGVQGETESDGPSESECRPFIDKALKELKTGDDINDIIDNGDTEDLPTVEITTDDTDHQNEDSTAQVSSIEETEGIQDVSNETTEHNDDSGEDKDASQEAKSSEDDDGNNDDSSERTTNTIVENITSTEDNVNSDDNDDEIAPITEDETVQETPSQLENEGTDVNETGNIESNEIDKHVQVEKSDEDIDQTSVEQVEATNGDGDNDDDTDDNNNDHNDKDETLQQENDEPNKNADDNDNNTIDSEENDATDEKDDDTNGNVVEETKDDSIEDGPEQPDNNDEGLERENDEEKGVVDDELENVGNGDGDDSGNENENENENEDEDDDDDDANEDKSAPEEDLIMNIEPIPDNLRDRSHVEHLLKLDREASETENVINRVSEITLKELKKLYENAIKPLEILYKYRDLSNRHFGDAEIFSKPLILFMGPWSGGKSSIINYLLDNEYNETSLRTGAEPSPAYFNILTYGDEYEVIDGTQLAADFTFSGLQKFGQGLEERLRGVRLPSKLLEKVNIVEIPGILEVRKQVSRLFPFNDACQWFIDRADIIFLVYDPSKLDVGPETEAILDQLKGREHQTRIVLNKADQVKPEELMRVQGALIWNISPLMSSAQPPVMYTTSLWSRPYESFAPVRLLHAQERAFLRDLRSAVDKRIENKIASARRFAVRVRNHAKMVDCYLTTYYNHKSVFGNRKLVADQIIEHPQDYHIYEGLSTLTNISRYDLPDPEVYREFFKLNPLYEFQQLSATCTYFRGCPINRLDIAIAYDLPELVGKHRRTVENALLEIATTTSSSKTSTDS